MKVSNFRSIAVIAALIASSGILSACGTQNQLYNQGQNGYLANTGGMQTSSGSTAQQRCSSVPNVNGQGFFNTIDRQYRACNGTAVGGTTAQLAIFPEDRQSKQVCVFPIQQVNGVNSVYVVNPYVAPAGRYLVQCVGVAGTGSIMSFSNVNVKGAFVVNYNDAANFANCLATGDVASCAANSNLGYSVGYWN